MKHALTHLVAALLTTFGAHAKPLKVFILAGQFNMEGPANVSTFDYIGDDPSTASQLKMMRGADGKPSVCEQTWLSYLTGANDKTFALMGKAFAEANLKMMKK
jgi:hypothetical protein